MQTMRNRLFAHIQRPSLCLAYEASDGGYHSTLYIGCGASEDFRGRTADIHCADRHSGQSVSVFHVFHECETGADRHSLYSGDPGIFRVFPC